MTSPSSLSGEPPPTITVHLSSLASGITTDDLTFYFEAAAPDAKVTSPVVLGGGRAKLVLEGLTAESE